LLKDKSNADILIPSNSATFDTNERDMNLSHDAVSHENSKLKIDRPNANHANATTNSEQGNHFYMSLNYNKGQMQFVA